MWVKTDVEWEAFTIRFVPLSVHWVNQLYFHGDVLFQFPLLSNNFVIIRLVVFWPVNSKHPQAVHKSILLVHTIFRIRAKKLLTFGFVLSQPLSTLIVCVLVATVI